MQPDATTSNPLFEKFEELMAIPGVPWIVYTALLVCLVLSAIYVVGLFRDMAMGSFGDSPEEDLDLIREIRDRDMIADEEFEKAKELIRKNVEAHPILNAEKDAAERQNDSGKDLNKEK